jgi:hypothetical protein
MARIAGRVFHDRPGSSVVQVERLILVSGVTIRDGWTAAIDGRGNKNVTKIGPVLTVAIRLREVKGPLAVLIRPGATRHNHRSHFPAQLCPARNKEQVVNVAVQSPGRKD